MTQTSPPSLNTMIPGALIAVDQLALLLNCSKRHIYRLTDSGRMPSPVRLGSLVRWRQSDIDEWVTGGCQPSRSLRS